MSGSSSVAAVAVSVSSTVDDEHHIHHELALAADVNLIIQERKDQALLASCCPNLDTTVSSTVDDEHHIHHELALAADVNLIIQERKDQALLGVDQGVQEYINTYIKCVQGVARLIKLWGFDSRLQCENLKLASLKIELTLKDVNEMISIMEVSSLETSHFFLKIRIVNECTDIHFCDEENYKLVLTFLVVVFMKDKKEKDKQL
ncbi:hypothetical protein CDL12_21611 [Handroanthus impetiginosus]|uniref:Uncharacterized protein n=1 Tax=Handroanthus impetiginosus TaxID=429701 RepID=A0A2G9GLF5_9LAMI|nr:hypothetical protein CDL12_21611 [Handroanthus impetiginosus]